MKTSYLTYPAYEYIYRNVKYVIWKCGLNQWYVTTLSDRYIISERHECIEYTTKKEAKRQAELLIDMKLKIKN